MKRRPPGVLLEQSWGNCCRTQLCPARRRWCAGERLLCPAFGGPGQSGVLAHGGGLGLGCFALLLHTFSFRPSSGLSPYSRGLFIVGVHNYSYAGYNTCKDWLIWVRHDGRLKLHTTGSQVNPVTALACRVGLLVTVASRSPSLLYLTSVAALACCVEHISEYCCSTV